MNTKGFWINADTRIDAEEYSFRMEEAPVRTLQMKVRRGQQVCLYPKGQIWTSPALQAWIVQQVEEGLRLHARVLFPPRLRAMAEERGLHFQSVTIRKSRGRWGSCSSRGSINLSLYLMLVPRHLQDYVMQHELTHLQEMNHGVRFWHLLDQAVGGRAKALRAELRAYDTSVIHACSVSHTEQL